MTENLRNLVPTSQIAAFSGNLVPTIALTHRPSEDM